MKNLLEFLFTNMGVEKTPEEWCKLLKVKVIDADGWDQRYQYSSWEKAISLEEFISRLRSSTIDLEI